MTTDFTKIIGGVTREVTTRDYNGAPARVVAVTRTYPTTVHDLWDAITNQERLPRWFLPVSGDLKLGGRFQIVGNAAGEILTCEPPHRLGLTWEMNENVSWVNVELSEQGDDRARLHLEHIGHTPDEFWERYGAGAVGVGWDQALLLGLHKHLSGTPRVDPQEAMAWLASDEGQSFVRASSDSWCKASIAGGEDAALARAAAERTFKAYTGQAEG